MIIDFPKGPVKVDGKPILQDLRLNLAPNHQARIKTGIYRQDGTLVPVDIVVFNYTIPKMERLQIVFSINGKEMVTGVLFDFKLAYAFTEHQCRLTGSIGNIPVHQKFRSAIQGFDAMKDLIASAVPI